MEWNLTWDVCMVPDGEANAAQEAAIAWRGEAYPFIYYSPNRPAGDLFTPDEAFTYGSFVFTDYPLPLERVLRQDLVPFTVDTWIALAKAGYQAEYGENPAAWVFATANEADAEMVSFEPEGSGYRADFFDINSKTSIAWFDSLDAALAKAYLGGYRTPMPPDLLARMEAAWGSDGAVNLFLYERPVYGFDFRFKSQDEQHSFESEALKIAKQAEEVFGRMLQATRDANPTMTVIRFSLPVPVPMNIQGKSVPDDRRVRIVGQLAVRVWVVCDGGTIFLSASANPEDTEARFARLK